MNRGGGGGGGIGGEEARNINKNETSNRSVKAACIQLDPRPILHFFQLLFLVPLGVQSTHS